MKDFFARYREFHKNPIVIPAIFGLFLSLAIVAKIQGTPIDLGSISANVAAGIEEEKQYSADLIMQKRDNTLEFIIGKNADDVKTLYFTLLGNPEVLKSVQTSQANTTVSMNNPGVVLIRVTLNSSLKAGDIVTRLIPTMVGNSPLTVIDAGFSSATGDYSLSSKGE